MQILAAPSGIKSVQRGSATINAGQTFVNIAVSSVNVSKSSLSISNRAGIANTFASDFSSLFCSGKLQSSTQISLDRYSTTTGAVCLVEWELVEYV